MESLAFRAATEADIPALVALVTSAYRGDASRAGWTTEADMLDGQRIDPEVLRDDIARPRSRVVLAERGGLLLACAHVADEDDAGYFGMFSVSPSLQGAGVGKTVMAEAERIAREWGAEEIRMTVIRQREDLIAFYERRGFGRTGRFEPLPYGDERFGLPLRDDLEFAELAKRL